MWWTVLRVVVVVVVVVAVVEGVAWFQFLSVRG